MWEMRTQRAEKEKMAELVTILQCADIPVLRYDVNDVHVRVSELHGLLSIDQRGSSSQNYSACHEMREVNHLSRIAMPR